MGVNPFAPTLRETRQDYFLLLTVHREYMINQRKIQAQIEKDKADAINQFLPSRGAFRR